MNPWQKDVTNFHAYSGQSDPKRIVFSRWPGSLRLRLMQDELEETARAYVKRCVALTEKDRFAAEAEIIDGLVDLLYVVVGSAQAAGVDLAPFFELIHANNMSKVDGSLGPVVRREDGKILKPEGWKPPDVLGLLLELKAGEE